MTDFTIIPLPNGDFEVLVVRPPIPCGRHCETRGYVPASEPCLCKPVEEPVPC